MTSNEEKAILTLCLMAAFADNEKDDRERAQIRSIAESLSIGTPLDLAAVYQDVLLKRADLAGTVGALVTPELRNLAYEMAVCVCDADGAHNAEERAFLVKLREVLGLDAGHAGGVAEQAAEVASSGVPAATGATPAPTSPGAPAAVPSVDLAALDTSILNYAILSGALELLPQALASMAIIPLQMKMVYRVGRAYGYDLDHGHVKELLAMMGIGLTAQYVEQVGRKLLGGLLGGVAGRLGKGIGRQAASSAMSFATTYALGHAAKQYYGGGRRLEALRLRELFGGLLAQAQQLRGQYLPEIEQRAKRIDVSQLAQLVRG